MSAFVQDKAHIDALVRAAELIGATYFHEGRWVNVRDERDRVGQALVDANVRGVMGRYPQDEITELPGRTNAWWLIPYRYSSRGPLLEGVAALKAIAGYVYQADEFPEFDASEAGAFCRYVKDELIRHLAGWQDADTWAITDEDAAAAPRIVSLFDLTR